MQAARQEALNIIDRMPEVNHDSRFYARKVIQDIRDKADILDELPKIGK